MTKVIKVSFSPVYDTYVGRNDLEQALASVNLTELMPSETGARIAFFRTIRALEEEEGVRFQVLKETYRDIMWAVYLGRKNLGTYMVSYGIRGRHDKRPSFKSSKYKCINKAKTSDDKKLFNEVCASLNEAIDNAGINCYSFHLKVLGYMKANAAVVQDKINSYGPRSWNFYMDEAYRAQLEVICNIYTMFNAKYNWEEEEL